ncbi:hypothetical protein [Enterococcus rotai]|uniref:hypothetical protein n=1 Tax=Enterococcus rotai TaxID=118060 RepID=UPI0035C75693
MKKILRVMILIGILSFFPMQTVLAEEDVNANDLVIRIDPADTTKGKEVVGKPTPKFPNTNGSKNGSLPHLGQMITSFILLLSGIACLIVFCGVISMKKIYYSM